MIEYARVSGGSTNDIPRQCWRPRGECRMYIQSTPCQLKIKETASVRYPAYGHIQRGLHLPHQTGGQTMVCPPIWPPAMSISWLNSNSFLNSALSGHPSRQKPLLRLPRLAHNDTARRCSAEHRYTPGLQPRTVEVFVGPAVPSPTERARQDRTRPDQGGSRRISHSVTGSGEAMGRDGVDNAVSWPACQLPFSPGLQSQP